MFARIIQVQLHVGVVADATDYFRESVGPALKELPGFKNSRFLVNSTTYQCMMVTLWETEADRTDSESNGFLQGVLKDMKPFFAGQPVIDYYEVAVQVI